MGAITYLHAVNHTRQCTLAHEVRLADGFFSRLCGLLATPARQFGSGSGLWIRPSRGIHMWGMRYPIDALYLDRQNRVVHVERELQPWRLGAIRREAASVLELPAGMAAQTQVGDAIRLGLP